jgi:uncharacterized protein (TIGR02099 family)
VTFVVRMTSVLRQLVKWFYFLFAMAAILLAIVVQAGRSFSDSLADYPDEVSRYLSNQLNARVTIGSLKAEWDGLKPMVDLRDMRIASQGVAGGKGAPKVGQQIIALEHAQMRLDLLGSLRHLSLVWSVLQLDKAELSFSQTQDGSWHLNGLPRKVDSPDQPRADLNPLIDMSLLSRRIEFGQTKLHFKFASGTEVTLNSPLLRMENSGDFHRLTLQVDVDRQKRALFLIAEGSGDPRDRQHFSSEGFVHLQHFPTNSPIAATTAFLLRNTNTRMQGEGSLDARLWFSSRPQRDGLDLAGEVGIERLNLPVLERKLVLDSFNTRVMGHWLYSGQWQLGLQQLAAKVNNNQIKQLNLAAGAADVAAPIVLRLPKLELGQLQQTLDSAGVLGEGRLREVLRTLSPQGHLRNLQVAIPVQNPREWELQANLDKVGVNAWQGVPALRKVDGYLHANQRGGFVDIDSREGFSMHYYPTYNAPMEYQQARGQVAWHLLPEQNQIYVNSGALDFINGDEQAHGYMWLSLPWRRNTGDIDLYLQIGAKQLNASLYSKYTPAVLPQSLLKWLEASIGPNNPGQVNQVGFTYRGTLNTHRPNSRSHQLYLDMTQAQLKYHPEWPALDAINGRLLVSDDHVYASVDQARLFDSQVSDTWVQVAPNPEGKGELLKVDGQVEGAAADGLRVLRETMLRRYVGGNMDSWSFDGHMKTQVDIAVPLASDAPGAAQQIDIDLKAPYFSMANLNLTMRDLNGHISYNQDTGLASEGLQAILFDEPVTALLSTKKQGNASQTHVEVNGEVTAGSLAKWTQRPEALFLNGKVPYNAHVILNHRPASAAASAAASVVEAAPEAQPPFALVKVTSQLKDVRVDLPAPYGKPADVERALAFSMALRDHSSLIEVSYGDDLHSLFELDPQQGNKLLNANIALDSRARLSDTPMFLVSGNLPTIDINPWRKVLQQYWDFSAQLAADKPPAAVLPTDNTLVAGLPFRARVQLGEYQVGPLHLTDIAVEAEPSANAWKIEFTNSTAQGKVYLPGDNTKPLQINLQSLKLTSALLGLEPPPANAGAQLVDSKPRGPGLDPRTLPYASISVDELYMDGSNYGNWSLQMRPTAQGAIFEDINGSVRGVTIKGADGQSEGARMEWNLGDAGASTHFVGTLSATDLSDVLRQWQKPDTIESSNASFRADLSWAGDPQDFALVKLSGTMDIWLEKGRFKRNPGAGSDGFLRLMAILNFDSLARRLRLDFSDLYQSGLAYDHISGKVSFEPGSMTFTEPLMVISPSSRLQMMGKLNLEKERINTRLVATLPVVGNFTFFTALVTGLPAAAGIYVVSKLFKKQVDQATSISYSITGSWDDPKMSFDRLFESGESLRESVNQPEKPKPKPKRRQLKN